MEALLPYDESATLKAEIIRWKHMIYEWFLYDISNNILESNI